MIPQLRSLLGALLQRSDAEAGMDAELRFHLEEHTARLMREGLPEAEARRRARREFGSVEATREACRESRGLNLPEELLRNTRYATRLLVRNPGFTVTAVLTLALAIGANTAIFSVIDAVLLRPLPYPEPEKLVRVLTESKSDDGTATGINESQDAIAWEILNRNVEGVSFAASSYGDTVPVARAGQGEYVPGRRVTAGYFGVLGASLQLGRDFAPEEDIVGGPAVAILSHELWMRYFQGKRSAVGSTIHLRGEPHTIVGIAQTDVPVLGGAEVWTPLRVSRNGEGSGTNYFLFGRIDEGVDFGQAAQRVAAAGKAVMEGRKIPKDDRASLILVPLQEGMIGNNRTHLLVIWAAVGLVLLIACVNVSGLLLARAETRTQEVATRAALGGGSGAVLRQLLTESVVLAMLGGVLGTLFAWGGIRLLATYVTEELGIWQPIGMDARVFGLSLAASLITGVLFGLIPAMQTARVNLRDALTGGGSRSVAGRQQHWLQRVLVVGEVGLCLVLLIGAGLLIRTFLNIYGLAPGFDATNVLTTSVSMNDARYADATRVNHYFEQTLERVRAIPGVEVAAVGLHVPFERWLNIGVRIPGVPEPKGGLPGTTMNYVTAGYFEALRIPILAGRAIQESDTEDAGPIVVVNETFVRRYLNGASPLGQTIVLGGDKFPRTITGVVADVQQTPGLTRGAPFKPEPAMYVPARQLTGLMAVVHTWFSPKWVIRGRAKPETLVPQLEKAFAAVDPLLPTTTFRPVEAFRGERLGIERAMLTLLGVLASLALLLGAVGVYGLVSQQVSERRREMGIRIVMGSSPLGAIGKAAIPGIVLAAVGLVGGVLLAALSTRFLENRIFGVRPLDPATFVLAALFLLLVATVASILPALRLLRFNPAQTLRAE